MTPPLDPPKVPVSLVVLTQDEAHNIVDCLASAVGFDDIHVVDSGSTDGTVSIAQNLGATIHRHPFAGIGQQRNWAIDNTPVRHEWQLQLDADERLTPALIQEIVAVVSRDPPVGGYLMASKLIFAGQWLRRASQYPCYQVRLFHRRRLRFADHGHGQREVTDYPLGQLREPYLHLAFSRGLEHWFAKHADYARREAEQALGLNSDHQGGGAGYQGRLLSLDPTLRRRALKRLAARLPCRYFLRLLYMLVVQMGFLDGKAGITYAHMIATYEAMIEVNLRLLRSGQKV
jgi:glycosyltransferase involved in cell wall biosynthesis